MLPHTPRVHGPKKRGSGCALIDHLEIPRVTDCVLARPSLVAITSLLVLFNLLSAKRFHQTDRINAAAWWPPSSMGNETAFEAIPTTTIRVLGM